jgi:hypothetical protein
MIGKSKFGRFIADLQPGIADSASAGRAEKCHASISHHNPDDECYGEETVSSQSVH